MVMQPSVSVAQQFPTASSTMPLASTTAVLGGKFPSATTGFGDALGKLLAAVAAVNQPAAPTDAATAPTTVDPPASVPTLQCQTPSGPAVACALPPPETAIRAPSDAESCKTPASQRARRGTGPRVTSASVSVDQLALPIDVQPLPAPRPLPDSTLEHAVPAAPPREHAEAFEQKEAVKAAPSTQTVGVSAAPTSVSVNATPSPPPQNVPAASTAQSAALPAIELTAQVPAALPETTAPSAPSDLAAAASPSHASSPAAQLAPALVQAGHAPDGAQRLTVRLDPPELGHVQVRIDRPAEAAARVEITVEKPETLTLLLRDQPQLQHALDLAGVPAEGRSVTFHIASPQASRNSEPATAPAPGVAAGGLSDNGSHGAPRQGGHSGRQQPSARDGGETEFTPIGLTGWLRGGLDITA
jgi:flagellar hook-length control protein FliK